MGENVIILFIFFILLIFAVVFFTRLQATKKEQVIGADIEGRGLQIAQRVALLPELQCTKDNAIITPGCYDEYSAFALDELAREGENKVYYFDLFGFSTVSIYKVFPPKEEEKPLVIYNNTKEEFRAIIPTYIPITLCNFVSDVTKGQCSFAVLKVEVYG